jgi:hypothetical protein
MKWKALLNYLASAIGIGLASFFGVAFVGGLPTRDSIAAGISAAISSMIAHVRQNPFKMED